MHVFPAQQSECSVACFLWGPHVKLGLIMGLGEDGELEQQAPNRRRQHGVGDVGMERYGQDTVKEGPAGGSALLLCGIEQGGGTGIARYIKIVIPSISTQASKDLEQIPPTERMQRACPLAVPC